MNWGAAISQGLGMLGGQGFSRKQYHRQKKLMAFQKQHQMDLNRHGQELAMDMWNQTNYKAQVQHLLDAGLNPGLIYGSAGAGGTTDAGSGGSAQGGQAPQERVMDLSAAKLGAEIKAIEEGVEYSKWQRGDKGTAEIGELDSRARKNNADAVLSEVDGKAKKVYEDKYIQGLVAQWEQHGQDKELKEIMLGLHRNGVHTPYIATIIGTLSGWDMTEKGVFDQRIGVLPEFVKNTLEKAGINIDPTVSRRTAMNMIIGGIAAGKIGMDLFRDFRNILFNPKKPK